jgi:type 1 glutamine amidotransferase
MNIIIKSIQVLIFLTFCAVNLFAQERVREVVQEVNSFNVLLFTKTEGFRHESIEAGVEVLLEQSIANDFNVVHTEDANIFNDEGLDSFAVVVFLSTTGDILNEDQQTAMELFIQSGKGFVGIHAATDTEYEWPWYNGLVGAYFSDHPPGVHKASIIKIADHHSVFHLPGNWIRTDEWYNFKSLKSTINPILNLDESSYEGGEMGVYHPVSWYQNYDGGRSWYTAGGHTIESFYEEDFVEHIVKGILWAARRFN